MKADESQRIDKRVLFDQDTLETIGLIIADMQFDKSINERERLGVAIKVLSDVKREFDRNFINLDETSKERVQTMLNFGGFASKEKLMAKAIEKLFEEQRETIINKIANL